MIVMDSNLLTVKEVAERLRLSEEAVRRLLRSKLLRGFVVQGSWRISQQDLIDYLNRQSNIKPEQED